VAAGAIATWEWISIVVLRGLTVRPGFFCLRAAVGPYLFHGRGISVVLFSKYTEVLRDHGIIESNLARGPAKHHTPGIDNDNVVS
jgi:hypothetical protein